MVLHRQNENNLYGTAGLCDEVRGDRGVAMCVPGCAAPRPRRPSTPPPLDLAAPRPRRACVRVHSMFAYSTVNLFMPVTQLVAVWVVGWRVPRCPLEACVLSDSGA